MATVGHAPMAPQRATIERPGDQRAGALGQPRANARRLSERRKAKGKRATTRERAMRMYIVTLTINLPDNTEVTRNLIGRDLNAIMHSVGQLYPNWTSVVLVVARKK